VWKSLIFEKLVPVVHRRTQERVAALRLSGGTPACKRAAADDLTRLEERTTDLDKQISLQGRIANVIAAVLAAHHPPRSGRPGGPDACGATIWATPPPREIPNKSTCSVPRERMNRWHRYPPVRRWSARSRQAPLHRNCRTR
jgi:hypothetical protein